MLKILEDAMGRQHVIINPTKPPHHIISARIDELKRHHVLWSGGKAEVLYIPYAYGEPSDVVLYDFLNLSKDPEGTDVTVDYWWSYGCSKDFVFTHGQGSYPNWYLRKLNKTGETIKTVNGIGYSMGFDLDDEHIYLSTVSGSYPNFEYLFTKFDFNLDVIEQVDLGDELLGGVTVDDDYIYCSGNYNLQKRNKSTLGVVASGPAVYAAGCNATCIDDDYFWLVDWDDYKIKKFNKSDLSLAGAINDSYILEPYGLWCDKTHIVAYDYGDWEDDSQFRKYRKSDGELVQTITPEEKLTASCNTFWDGNVFYLIFA